MRGKKFKKALRDSKKNERAERINNEKIQFIFCIYLFFLIFDFSPSFPEKKRSNEKQITKDEFEQARPGDEDLSEDSFTVRFFFFFFFFWRENDHNY